MLYCAGNDTKTTAGTGFYIPASLAFIRLHTLNYTDNDNDNTDYGINDENDNGVDNKTTASSYATRTTTTRGSLRVSVSTSPHCWRSFDYTRRVNNKEDDGATNC
uniref:Uncharacterized protein n=1 Tax=Plectus sambesii TaxID=2011161 RepID=A0A914VYH7_9BILA